MIKEDEVKMFEAVLCKPHRVTQVSISKRHQLKVCGRDDTTLEGDKSI